MRRLPLFFAALAVLTPAVAAPPPAPPPPLAIVIVEHLQRTTGSLSAFDRLDANLRALSRDHRWPGGIIVERFGAHTLRRPRELRLFVGGMMEEAPGELTFRISLVLVEGPAERDLGRVRCRYFPRLAERFDTIADRLCHTAAGLIAAKIESALFPSHLQPARPQDQAPTLCRCHPVRPSAAALAHPAPARLRKNHPDRTVPPC